MRVDTSLPPEMYGLLRTEARARRTTVSAVVRERLAAALQFPLPQKYQRAAIVNESEN